MGHEIMSKSGVKGINKRGKATTVAKKSKQRQQRRNDHAWTIKDGNHHSIENDIFWKLEDAWMFEHVESRHVVPASKSH